jgi:putative NADPH-quinone reductase
VTQIFHSKQIYPEECEFLSYSATPNPTALNHAIAVAAREQSLANRHEVDFHDLYAEGFGPLLPADELLSGGSVPERLSKYCEEAAAADGFVIVHPELMGPAPGDLEGVG